MYRAWWMAVGLMLLTVGCDRYIDSRDPVRTLPDPPPTPYNLTAAVDAESVLLRWEVGDPGAVARFRIYRADSADTAGFRLVDSTAGTEDSIRIGNLPTNRAYAFAVASVDAGGREGYRSTPIVVRLAPMSIVINDDAEYTNRRQVQIRFTAPASTVQVILAEDSAALGTAPVLPFAASRNFTLSEGDGLKSVYCRLVFDNGTTSGRPIYDDIVLDTRAAIDSVYFSPSGSVFAPGDLVTFFLAAADGETGGTAAVSFGGETVTLFDDGLRGDSTADDGVYSAAWVVPAGLALQDVLVEGTFTDAAGNSADPRSAGTRISIQDLAPLEGVTLAGVVADSVTIRLSWSRFDGEGFSSYQLYRDTLPPPAPDSLDLATAQSIAIINTAATDTFNDYRPAAGTYYYQVFVTDTYGRRAGSNVVAVVK